VERAAELGRYYLEKHSTFNAQSSRHERIERLWGFECFGHSRLLFLKPLQGVFSNSNWSAPVHGRNKLETAGPSEIVENCRYAGIAAAEDGRAPYFENTPNLLTVQRANLTAW
jgi:hypothetical protein